VRLSPIGTSATTCPIVPVPDDRCWSVWSSRWNENWQEKPKYSEKTCPSITFSTTNPTRSDLGSNVGRCSGKPATNHLSYGTNLQHCLERLSVLLLREYMSDRIVGVLAARFDVFVPVFFDVWLRRTWCDWRLCEPRCTTEECTVFWTENIQLNEVGQE
jgi:hypothetical protein